MSAGRAESLDALKEECLACHRCNLRAGCRQVVFGEGNPRAALMFVGEGPGLQEDVQGRPFVGAAGHLLDRIIAAMGLERGDVYIANVVKCRPPGNRLPTPQEAQACLPHLLAQIKAVKPRVVVCLGAIATQSLIPTFHPAALLRDETKKRPVWEDMKKVMAALGRLGAHPRTPGTPGITDHSAE